MGPGVLLGFLRGCWGRPAFGDWEEGGHKVPPIGGRFGALSGTRQVSWVPKLCLWGSVESAGRQPRLQEATPGREVVSRKVETFPQGRGLQPDLCGAESRAVGAAHPPRAPLIAPGTCGNGCGERRAGRRGDGLGLGCVVCSESLGAFPICHCEAGGPSPVGGLFVPL